MASRRLSIEFLFFKDVTFLFFTRIFHESSAPTFKTTKAPKKPPTYASHLVEFKKGFVAIQGFVSLKKRDDVGRFRQVVQRLGSFT